MEVKKGSQVIDVSVREKIQMMLGEQGRPILQGRSTEGELNDLREAPVETGVDDYNIIWFNRGCFQITDEEWLSFSWKLYRNLKKGVNNVFYETLPNKAFIHPYVEIASRSERDIPTMMKELLHYYWTLHEKPENENKNEPTDSDVPTYVTVLSEGKDMMRLILPNLTVRVDVWRKLVNIFIEHDVGHDATIKPITGRVSLIYSKLDQGTFYWPEKKPTEDMVYAMFECRIRAFAWQTPPPLQSHCTRYFELEPPPKTGKYDWLSVAMFNRFRDNIGNWLKGGDYCYDLIHNNYYIRLVPKKPVVMKTLKTKSGRVIEMPECQYRCYTRDLSNDLFNIYLNGQLPVREVYKLADKSWPPAELNEDGTEIKVAPPTTTFTSLFKSGVKKTKKLKDQSYAIAHQEIQAVHIANEEGTKMPVYEPVQAASTRRSKSSRSKSRSSSSSSSSAYNAYMAYTTSLNEYCTKHLEGVDCTHCKLKHDNLIAYSVDGQFHLKIVGNVRDKKLFRSQDRTPSQASQDRQYQVNKIRYEKAFNLFPSYVKKNVYKKRHAEPFMNDKKVQVLRSRTGTGKTTAMIEYLRNNLKKGDTVKSILFISTRRSYTTFIKALVESKLDIDVVNYLENDVKKIRNGQSLVSQTESLHDIPRSFHIVVIDEVTASMFQMTSKLHKHKSIMNKNRLNSLVRDAEHILAMDADIDMRTIRYLRSCRPKDDIYLHWNEYQRPLRRAIVYRKGQEYLFWRALDDKIDKGYKVNIVVSSTEEAKRLASHLTKKDVKFVYHWSENPLTKTLKENNTTLETLWMSYQVVMFTSTITVGIDFMQEYFDVQFVYGSSLTNSVREIKQMMNRARHIKSGEIHIYNHIVNCNEVVDLNRLSKFYNRKMDITHALMCQLFSLNELVDYTDPETGLYLYRLNDDTWSWLNFMNRLEVNLSRNYYEEMCNWMLEDDGYQIIEASTLVDDTSDTANTGNTDEPTEQAEKLVTGLAETQVGEEVGESTPGSSSESLVTMTDDARETEDGLEILTRELTDQPAIQPAQRRKPRATRRCKDESELKKYKKELVEESRVQEVQAFASTTAATHNNMSELRSKVMKGEANEDDRRAIYKATILSNIKEEYRKEFSDENLVILKKSRELINEAKKELAYIRTGKYSMKEDIEEKSVDPKFPRLHFINELCDMLGLESSFDRHTVITSEKIAEIYDPIVRMYNDKESDGIQNYFKLTYNEFNTLNDVVRFINEVFFQWTGVRLMHKNVPDGVMSRRITVSSHKKSLFKKYQCNDVRDLPRYEWFKYKDSPVSDRIMVYTYKYKLTGSNEVIDRYLMAMYESVVTDVDYLAKKVQVRAFEKYQAKQEAVSVVSEATTTDTEDEFGELCSDSDYSHIDDSDTNTDTDADSDADADSFPLSAEYEEFFTLEELEEEDRQARMRERELTRQHLLILDNLQSQKRYNNYVNYLPENLANNSYNANNVCSLDPDEMLQI